jgi:hypothetical protein
MDRGVSGREIAINEILKALLKEPLCFEKIVSALDGKVSRGTVSKYLKELVINEKWVELAPRSFGEKSLYSIIKSKKHQVMEQVEAYKKKQEFGPQFENLFKFASPEELEEITNFLFSIPVKKNRDGKRLFGLGIVDNPIHNLPTSRIKKKTDHRNEELYRILLAVRNRQRKKIFEENSLLQLAQIGEKILSGEYTSPFEELEFYIYPIDAKEAADWISTGLYLLFTKGQNLMEYIRRENPQYAKILENRYGEILNGRIPEAVKKEFSENIYWTKTVEGSEFLNKNSKIFGTEFTALLPNKIESIEE